MKLRERMEGAMRSLMVRLNGAFSKSPNYTVQFLTLGSVPHPSTV